MHRLQISLTKTQYEFLKSEAFTSNKSMAAVLRDLLDEVITSRQETMLENDPIWKVIGIAQEVGGPTNVSENADKYLYGEPVASEASPLQKVAEEEDEYPAD